ncbi:MAG: hypothetical protein ACYDGX_10085 [Thermoleophilia bacterium]
MTVMLACGLIKEKKNLYTLNRKNGVLTMGSTTLSWYGDAWDWIKKKTSEEKRNFVTFSQEYINEERKGINFPHPLSDTEFAKLSRDPGIDLGFAIGVGVPGDEYTPEMSFYGGSKPIDEFGEAACPETVTVTLDNIESLRGASMEEVKSLIPNDWEEMPLRRGAGVRYLNPNRPGESIMLEEESPTAEDPLHQGPYVKISKDGIVTRIPLEGNPVLGG